MYIKIITKNNIYISDGKVECSASVKISFQSWVRLILQKIFLYADLVKTVVLLTLFIYYNNLFKTVINS